MLTAHLNLKMERWSHNFPHSPPKHFILFIITNDVFHFSFKLLRCYYDKLFCFKRKSYTFNFNWWALHFFQLWSFLYFCLYFLYSFNYEDLHFSFDWKLAQKPLNQIFTQSRQLWIKKWKSKIYKLGKVDDRISVLQVTRSRIKNQNQKETDMWIEKEGFIPGSRLDWWLKNSRSILEWSWTWTVINW